MIKTKFVTSYYMDISEFTNYKWIGAYSSRKPRYLSSLINYSRNFPSYEIVCYTHEINFEELKKIKVDFNLNNFFIKVKELDEIKYTKDLDKVISNVPDYNEKFNLPGRPPQVMWGKFDLMSAECVSDANYIYWVDAGLQAIQLFPKRYNPNINDYDIWTNLEKQGNFNLLFNEVLINKLTDIIKDKFCNIMCATIQSHVYSFEDYEPTNDYYPIGGFFGGKKSLVLKYCDIFDDIAKKHLNNNLLCFEDSIMKQVTDKFSQEEIFKFLCDTHAHGLTDDQFHHEEWDSNKKLPKPIWRIWEEIRDNFYI